MTDMGRDQKVSLLFSRACFCLFKRLLHIHMSFGEHVLIQKWYKHMFAYACMDVHVSYYTDCYQKEMANANWQLPLQEDA